MGEGVKTVAGATVTTDGVPPVYTDDLGYYQLEASPGEHVLKASTTNGLEGSNTCNVDAGGFSECNITISREEDTSGEKSSSGGCSAVQSSKPPYSFILLFLLGLASTAYRSKSLR